MPLRLVFSRGLNLLSHPQTNFFGPFLTVLPLLVVVIVAVVDSVVVHVTLWMKICEPVRLSGVSWQCMVSQRVCTYPSFIETLQAALALDCGYLNRPCFYLLPGVSVT